jgi:hypothetical protein
METITVAVELSTEQIDAIQIQMGASNIVEPMPEFVSRMTKKLVSIWADQQRAFFWTFNQQNIMDGIKRIADDPQRIEKLASIGITVTNPSYPPPIPPNATPEQPPPSLPPVDPATLPPPPTPDQPSVDPPVA